MGIKLTKALWNKVIAISKSVDKRYMSLQTGADIFEVSINYESMVSAKGTCS
jgi:D-arabinose 1-dehydrogenase-like Zn-dependent alcohol dehydrogenase